MRGSGKAKGGSEGGQYPLIPPVVHLAAGSSLCPSPLTSDSATRCPAVSTLKPTQSPAMWRTCAWHSSMSADVGYGIWPVGYGIYLPERRGSISPTFHLSPLKSKAKIKTQLKLIGKGICFKGMPGPERKNPERKINVPSSGIQGTRRRRLMGGGRVGARPHTLKLQLHTLVTNNKGAGKKYKESAKEKSNSNEAKSHQLLLSFWRADLVIAIVIIPGAIFLHRGKCISIIFMIKY